MSHKNYYNILGVDSTATTREIKNAYRKLSKQFHPDRNDGDSFLADMFKNINEAYEVLSNEEKRSSYDQSLKFFSDNFNQNTYQKPHKEESSDYSAEMIQDFQDLVDNVQLSFEQSTLLVEKEIALYNAEYIPVPRYFTFKKAIFSLSIIFISWLIFDGNLSFDTQEKSASFTNQKYDFTTNKKTSIYLKPNIKSAVIGKANKGDQFNSLRKTKYFIKVSFDNNSNITNGYILKDHLIKN